MPGITLGVEGVGQVVEHDAGPEIEQVAFAGEERVFQRSAVVPQGVGDPVEVVAGHLAGRAAEQFGERGIVVQPTVGFAFARWMQGAGQDLGQAEAHVAQAQAAGLQRFAQAQIRVLAVLGRTKVARKPGGRPTETFAKAWPQMEW